MKKFLIYKDEGTNSFSIASLIETFKQENLDKKFSIEVVNREIFNNDKWQKDTHLLVFPGGLDVPYHLALKGSRNQSIRTFVENGGNFLGICAGGYYGSSKIEFEKEGPLEVIESRELKFFPGLASGPAYGLGKFKYQSEEGAKVAKLLLSSPLSLVASYYNGGCCFVNAEKYNKVSVIARYSDLNDFPSAIIHCKVGLGQAILSGVHPEYSSKHRFIKKRMNSDIFIELEKCEEERRMLSQNILNLLNCNPFKF